MDLSKTKTFLTLKTQEQDEVLIRAFDRIPNCDPRVKDIYRYLCTQLDKGENKFLIPGLLVKAMVDASYRDDDPIKETMIKDNFKKKHLNKFGVRDRDWKIVDKKSISFVSSFKYDTENVYEFKVPGWPDKIPLKLDYSHHSSKHAFVTPNFAFSLIKKFPRSPISKAMDAFVDEVHTLARNFLKRVRASGSSETFNLTLANRRLKAARVTKDTCINVCRELEWDIPPLRNPTHKNVF